MIAYEKYKESDIEWFGNKIPEHWEVKRVKDVCEMQSGFYLKANDFVENGYPVYGGNGFRGFSENYNHNGNYILIGRQGALCGNINYAIEYFWATEHAIVVYEKKKINITWLGELLRIMNLNQYSLSAAQPGLSVERIKRLEIPFVPTIKEQTQIAYYLDNKTQAIDKKIDLLGQKVNKYKELKKSLINQTITKGLNPNVKFKNSGSDWIGEIPEHWEFKRMKDVGFLFSGLSGKSGSDFNQDDNLNNKSFLPFTNIASNTYINTNKFGKVVIDNDEKQNEIKKNDLFFLMSSEGYEDVGKAALLIDDVSETYLNSFCKGFRITNKKVEPKFLNWLLFSSTYREKLLVQGKGFTRINLKMDKINDFGFFIPKTRSEQTQIANYLDDKTKHIDNIINNVEDQITVLTELRKTLINDVVTGKIKVTA